MTSDARAQRLIEEFEEAAHPASGGFSVRHGLAAVLRHVAETEADVESFYAVPHDVLLKLANALSAPSLLDRALAGDREAARQFLREEGFTDASGQLVPWLRSEE